MKLIRALFDVIFPPRATQLLVETLTTADLMHLYRIRYLKRAAITYLLPYSDPRVRACIREAKFHRNERAITLLASVLRNHVYRIAVSHSLVPIPLSKQRFKERGYNQVEEILYAARLKYAPLLVRQLHSAPQTTLDTHQRKRNVTEAFICPTPPSPYHIYVLVDDVATTGATLNASKRALETAGARNILLLSLSH